MGAVAQALADEIRGRGFEVSIRNEHEKSAEVCVIESKKVVATLGDGVDEVDDTRYLPVGLEIWDFGLDPSGNVDVRWSDLKGQAQEYSAAPSSVDIKKLADRILGPEK